MLCMVWVTLVWERLELLMLASIITVVWDGGRWLFSTGGWVFSTCCLKWAADVEFCLILYGHAKEISMSSNDEGRVAPFWPITLELIHSRSICERSPNHIHFNMWPHSRSSWNQWPLSRNITAFRQSSQWQLTFLENKNSLSRQAMGWSCQKSPTKTMDIPPNTLVLYLHSFRWLSNLSISPSLMKDISSMMRILTYFYHSFSSCDRSPSCQMKEALQIVTPLKEEAAEPVYVGKKNVLSFQNTSIIENNWKLSPQTCKLCGCSC